MSRSLTRFHSCSRHLRSGLIVVLAMTVAAASSASAQESTAVFDLQDARSVAMTPSWLSTDHPNADSMPAITIDVAITVPAEAPGTVELWGTMTLQNLPTLARADGRLPLRLYPKADQYGASDMEVTSAQVDGIDVSPLSDGDPTIIWIPVQPATSLVSLSFTATVSALSTASFGIFSAALDSSSMLLGHWYPMPAPVLNDTWVLHPISEIGDPTLAAFADYEVTVHAPASMTVVATGSRTPSGPTGALTFVSGPVREVVLALGEGWVPLSEDVGESRITVWQSAATAEGAPEVLDAAAAALAIYNEAFGAYPYRELDIVPYELHGASGMEFPGMIVLSPSYWTAPLTPFAESVVAHEVAHQWWYGLVANDQYVSAFLDEGISQMVGTRFYFGERYGAERGDAMFDSQAGSLFQTSGGLDAIRSPGLPIEDYATMEEYFIAVYAGGGVAFNDLEDMIGRDAFADGLRSLVTDSAFSFVTEDQFRSAWEVACDCDLTTFWETWFGSS